MVLPILISTLLSFSLPTQSVNVSQDAPISGYDSTSIWKGYTRYHLSVKGRKAFITAPQKPLSQKEWVWRARFPEWHTEMDEILLDSGLFIAYIDAENMLGGPEAMELWDSFYEYLVGQQGFAARVSLEGVSRGGLFVFNWAKRHPWKVHSIYTEAPVCDFKSWPGGYGAGKGDQRTWKILKKQYGFNSDQEALEYKNNPIDKLESLALARVPIMTMIGLNDQIVPPSENIYLLSDRYVKLGGISTLVPCTRGKQELHGHHFTIESPKLGAEFILSKLKRQNLPMTYEPYHKARQGLHNSFHSFEKEKEGRVAFLGGSITQNGGWRDSICHYLQLRFPGTSFEFIPAGIASMGSTPGAFRLNRDILSKGPVDLLFVEAAVNDASNGRSSQEQIRGMEGIIRHSLRVNPQMDIVVMHFVDPDKMESYNRGEVPEVIRNFEAVTEHYQVGTLNLALEVTHRINNGEFSWEKDFKNLHPSPFGQGVYARSMIHFLENSYEQAASSGQQPHPLELPEALDPFSYAQGKLISIDKAFGLVGFTHIENWSPGKNASTRKGYANVKMLVGEQPGDQLSLNFDGRAVGIMVAAGPDAGSIEYCIDGAEPVTLDLFTAWSKHLYLPWYYTLDAELDPGPHTLNVTISEQKNPDSAGHSCIIKSFYINQ
jgi:pimeloyl-ACP methyl ester carboxylesterase/lysophospholipase L1-like esterase